MTYDTSTGFLIDTEDELLESFLTYIESRLGITIERLDSEVFIMIGRAIANSQLQVEYQFQSIIDQINSFYNDTENKIKNVNVSTQNSVESALSKLDYIVSNFVKTPQKVEEAGTSTIWIETSLADEEYKTKYDEIGQVLHNTLPVYCWTNIIDTNNYRYGYGLDIFNARFKYNWNDVTVKYFYVKIIFYTAPNQPNIDIFANDQAKDGLKKMLSDRGYNIINKNFEYQDFIDAIKQNTGVAKVDILFIEEDNTDKLITDYTDTDWINKNANIICDYGYRFDFDIDNRLLISYGGIAGE